MVLLRELLTHKMNTLQKIKHLKDQLTFQIIHLGVASKLICTRAFRITFMLFGRRVCVCLGNVRWGGGMLTLVAFGCDLSQSGNAAAVPVLTHFSARISRD